MEIDKNNPEFNKAYDIIANPQHNSLNTNLFITGVAGTGKSTFLQHITKTIKKNIVVLAPTGIAAINAGGQTINSFFGFPPRALMLEDKDIRILPKKDYKYDVIKEMDVLIIDEISMVRPDIMDAIDYSLRRNGGDPNWSFGGKQIILMGDMFQLEPVRSNTADQELVNSIYDSHYFYSAKVFKRACMNKIEFQKTYRQSDPKFIELLNKVRNKTISHNELEIINTRVRTIYDLIKLDNIITLTTTNKMAEMVNLSRLNQLHSPVFNYHATISEIFEQSKFPTEKNLVLKKGAQVMFIYNDNPHKRWVNGTIGTIHELHTDRIKVKLENGKIHIVPRITWENINYKYSGETGRIEKKVIGEFQQYPLKLAWGITIHKSQGLTYDRAIIDFGRGTFANGQAYVALSRLRSFEGINLKRPISIYDIKIDKKIIEFYRTFDEKFALKNISDLIPKYIE